MKENKKKGLNDFEEILSKGVKREAIPDIRGQDRVKNTTLRD